MILKAELNALCFLIYIIELYHCVINVKDIENNVTVVRIADATSQFGGDFVGGAVAYLIESHPILACNKTIDPPPINMPNTSEIMFVSLIRRGVCTFEDKVKAAQFSGYHGVIIYNNNSEKYFPMPLPDYSRGTILIPSRMVGLTAGNNLRRFTFTLLRQQFVVVFYKDFDFNPQYYIIAFLGFVSLGFIIIGIGFAIKLCRDYRKRRSNRLKKCHLKKIPVKKFIKGEDSFDTCAICLDDFMDGDKLRILPCNHAYHMKCIDPWLLKQRRNCPICKSRIKIPGHDEESEDSNSIAAQSDATNTVLDEHTPLINSRDQGGSLPSYFSNNEAEVNFVPDHSHSLVHNCYENPCIDSNDDHTPVAESLPGSMATSDDVVVQQTIVDDDSFVVCHSTDMIKIV